MSDYPFTINSIPFYASEEPNWQAYGVLNSTTTDGRPNPAGTGSFSATVRAMAYDDTYLTGAGAPFETSGTFKQLVGIWKDSATSGYTQTYQILDPRLNAYITVTGKLSIDRLLSALVGGAALSDVPIVVEYAFISDADRATYYGGEPAPVVTAPPYIPGDELPAPDPLRTYGWGIGRWGYGYWGRGEGA